MGGNQAILRSQNTGSASLKLQRNMFSVGTLLSCKVEVGMRKLDSSWYLMECKTTPSAYQGALLILSTMHELSHRFQASVHGPKGRLFSCGADVMLGFYHKAKQMDVLLRPIISCRIRNHHRISGFLGNREPCGNNKLCKCFWFDVSRASLKSNYPAELWTNGFSAGSTPCSTGAVPDVSVDDVPHEERLDGPGVSFNQKLPGDNILKLISGSCYLPHPEKEETGGEDAHFISSEHAIGVADGVGGWADLGIDAGHYARELMSHSVSAIAEEPKGSIDPARVLEKAYFSTKARGSSTACIIALTNQGIHAVNLGDSGFIIVRDGCVVFRSPVQQHDFNFTYQLESGNASDLPSSGQVFTFPVVPGDVIVAGTDGLFDNVYKNEVASVVVHATRAGLGPQVAAQKIAALARQRAQDRHRQTPFSTAAQEAGYRYYGGKLDDITVVVSYVTVASP